MLTLADKGGRGGQANADIGRQRGEGRSGKCLHWLTKWEKGLANAEIPEKCLKIAKKY